VPWFIKPIIKYPEQEVIASFNSTIIELGRVLKTSYPTTIGVPVNNLFEHIFVTGSTGSGKTFTVAKLINQMCEKRVDATTIVLDWHGEYSSLVKKYTYLSPSNNPLNLPLKEYHILVDLLTDTFELTYPQAFILEKILKEYSEKISDINDLINVIENYEETSGWMRESRFALLRRLSPLRYKRYSELFRNDLEKDLVELICGKENGVFILDLSLIESIMVRRIYAALLIKKIFNKALHRKLRNKLVIVLEEAQNYISREKPLRIISPMLAEVRKFGVGLVIVSQSPYKLLEDAMINTNTKIIHSIKSSADLEIITKVLYLPMEYQKIIPYLDVGEAIFYTRGLKKPLIIKIEYS